MARREEFADFVFPCGFFYDFRVYLKGQGT